ncbi:hypothetical protein [Afifella sp. IM 167]|uniref:hypothetical protein n=1 Tax=Afifella sp. IM 167 TaxID=2033586 RepID=UPI001CCFDDAD|nr:hypothetical protein [Afifella sp. IM 167]MBZ8133201.1 hypothetical protein [Afifella sp. IM 167]
MTAISDITIYEGNSLTLETIGLKDSSGLLVDLTGAAIRFRAAPSVSSPAEDVFIDKLLGAGVRLLGDPEDASYAIDIDPADTVGHAGTSRFDVDLVLASGKVLKPSAGRLIVRPSLLASA